MSNVTFRTGILFSIAIEQTKKCPICSQEITFLPKPVWVVAFDQGGVAGALCLPCATRHGVLMLRLCRSFMGRRFGAKKDTPVARVLNGLTEKELEAAGYQIVETPVEKEVPLTVVEFPIEEIESLPA